MCLLFLPLLSEVFPRSNVARWMAMPSRRRGRLQYKPPSILVRYSFSFSIHTKGCDAADEQLRCKMKTLCAGVPAVTCQSGNRRTVCLDAVLSRQVKNQEKAGRLIGR